MGEQAELVSREEAERLLHARPPLGQLIPALARTIIEQDIAINGDCGCPPPWDQCPHCPPLLPSLNNATEAQERLAEVARKAGASERDIFIAMYNSTVGAPPAPTSKGGEAT